MLVMTSHIEIGNTKNIKPKSVTITEDVGTYIDTCVITLPIRTYLKNNYKDSPPPVRINTAVNTIFNTGDKVEVYLGYDGNNKLKFKGFVSNILMENELNIECEGYAYLFKNKFFTKSYQKTTLKQILQDLTKDSDIKLSKYIPDLQITNLTFDNYPYLRVLDYFKQELLCNVTFYDDVLYVGALKYATPFPQQTVKDGWNVENLYSIRKVKEKELVRIVIEEKSDDGCCRKTKSSSSFKTGPEEKKVTIKPGLSESFKQIVADELQKQNDYKGYEGTLRCFLEPYFRKGYICEVISDIFPEKNTLYFVEKVQTNYNSSNDYQSLTLKYYSKT